MDENENEPPTTLVGTGPHGQRHGKQRRLAVVCGAAVAAALFTPVPATAETSPRLAPETVAVSTVRPPMPPPQLAGLLISSGLIGVGLAMGGLVVITHRRRQW